MSTHHRGVGCEGVEQGYSPGERVVKRGYGGAR